MFLLHGHYHPRWVISGEMRCPTTIMSIELYCTYLRDLRLLLVPTSVWVDDDGGKLTKHSENCLPCFSFILLLLLLGWSNRTTTLLNVSSDSFCGPLYSAHGHDQRPRSIINCVCFTVLKNHRRTSSSINEWMNLFLTVCVTLAGHRLSCQ